MVTERTILKSYSKKLEHLGIIAALIEIMGIVALVNERLPKLRHHKLTHGDIFKAIIINGLGFTQRRLYLFPEFFNNKAVKRLFGEGITAEDLNEDVVGRTLDAIKLYGPEKLFQEIISQIYLYTKLGHHRVHVDTTNFSVHGAYDKSNDESTISIVKGHPKDGRWELNRFGIGLIVNQIGVPLFMKMLSGNDADKVTLPDMIKQFRSQVDFSEPLTCVADSALYSGKNIEKIADDVFFVTLVPATIGEWQNLVRQQDLTLTQMQDPRYSFYEVESSYGGTPQKWVMFHSQMLHEKHEKTLKKNRATEMQEVPKSLSHLKNRTFACEIDAINEGNRTIKAYPHYELKSIKIVTTQKKQNGSRGRPKKDEVMKTVFSISATVKLKDAAWVDEQCALGKFVLATNNLDMSAEELLSTYKGQRVVENGFRFLNDKSFSISDVFLKNKGRIEALGMLMILMLAVYSLGEYQLRQRLAELNITVLNQVKKPTAKPTLKWVLTFFDGVSEFYEYDPKTDSVRLNGLLNMTDRCWTIVELFGPVCEKYYL
jgi:transposase